MNESLPSAKSSNSPDERAKLQRIIAQRRLAGLANDTKWNELITAMRSRKDWRPPYRVKCVDGPASYWDAEWFYHLPFPLLSIEWIDIVRLQRITTNRLPSSTHVIDHSTWIEQILREIGLDYRMDRRCFAFLGTARVIMNCSINKYRTRGPIGEYPTFLQQKSTPHFQ
jgi:hypothetical protein